jgi:glycosyltransferase involved in cell wall biosynthesis
MKAPLVSIIIPFYNTGDLARNIIPSVLNQSYENLELIFIDDGSTDNTLDL